jgi:hypothetical protein
VEAVIETEPGLAVIAAEEPVELNVAVTVLAAFMATVHEPVPVQAPLHPAKADPAVGVAVSVTELFAAKFAEHVPPQSMPVGEEVTVPLPVPALVTAREKLPVGVAVAALEAVLSP